MTSKGTTLHHVNHVVIPDDVELTCEKRIVTVTGVRGTLVRDFSHTNLEFRMAKNKKVLNVGCWFGKRKQLALTRTICTHIQNMILGVTKGFRYKMRLIYAHYPINVAPNDAGTVVEIRNFLGEKEIKTVKMHPGCTIYKDDKVKDQIIVEGNDIEAVSGSCADVTRATKVHNKDVRKFLDGVMVSEKGTIEQEDEDN